MSNLPRRDFLQLTTQILLTTSGLLGLGGMLRFLHFQTEPRPQTEFDLGAAADYPPGTHNLLPEIPAVLIHNEQGFSALSLVCPHLGCTVEPKTEGFDCPCHGSRYDAQGNVLRGPAATGLVSLRVETLANGNLRLSVSERS